MAVASWGLGLWGGPESSAWGAGQVPGSPILGAIQDSPCDVKGGTVLGIFGNNFVDPTLIEIVDMIGLETLGTAYYFEARLDLRKSKILAGFPALPVGTYGVKLTTIAGTTPVLPNAVTYAVFAEEGKVQRVRRRYASPWSTGERLLT